MYLEIFNDSFKYLCYLKPKFLQGVEEKTPFIIYGKSL